MSAWSANKLLHGCRAACLRWAPTDSAGATPARPCDASLKSMPNIWWWPRCMPCISSTGRSRRRLSGKPHRIWVSERTTRPPGSVERYHGAARLGLRPMRVELPFLAEGVEGGDVVQVLVHEGDQVTEGQSLIELETDKATVPVPAPAAGKITRLLVRQGDHLKVGQALVELEGADGEAQASKISAPERPAIAPAPQPPPAVEAAHANSVQQREGHKAPPSPPSEQPATEPVHAAPAADRLQSAAATTIAAPPSVRRLARELGVDLTQVKGSEAGGRITAEDVKAYVRERTRRL